MVKLAEHLKRIKRYIHTSIYREGRTTSSLDSVMRFYSLIHYYVSAEDLHNYCPGCTHVTVFAGHAVYVRILIKRSYVYNNDE